MIKVLHETHETPKSVAHSLEIAGGINRFREPNYRAIWGWNRLAWIGGKFAERDPATGSLLREVVELRQEPKYPAVNRWHIEKWMPPENSCSLPRRSPSTSRAPSNGRASIRVRQGSARFKIVSSAKSAATTHTRMTFSMTASRRFTGSPSYRSCSAGRSPRSPAGLESKVIRIKTQASRRQ